MSWRICGLVDWLAWRAQEGRLTIVYKFVKWALRWYYRVSHIQWLCDYASQHASRSNYDLAIGMIIAQIQASEQLATPVAEEKDCKMLARSIASIKNIDPSNKEFEVLYEAVKRRRSLMSSVCKCKAAANEKPSWEKFSTQLVAMHDSVLNGCKTNPKPLSKGQRDWVALGFQGADPTTDFRGSGTYGLQCLHYLCVQDPNDMFTILCESGSYKGNIKRPWYSAALVSIHHSRYLANLQPPQMLKLLVQSGACNVYELHSIVFKKFHRFWLEEVESGKVLSVLDCEASLQRFQRAHLLE